MDRDNENRVNRIERLLEVSRRLGEPQSLDDLLTLVVTYACELSNSCASTILLFEEETNLLKFVVSFPISASQAENNALRRTRIPLENSLFGYVYQNSKAVIVKKGKVDERVFREVERVLQTKVDSLLAVPLIFRGETIGVLAVINRANSSHYTEEDVQILETLAAQAAVTILSTLMLDETRRAYDELEELERLKTEFIAIASHELRTPLGLIIGHASFLKDSVSTDDQRQEVDVIIRSAGNLKKIIEDLSSVNQFQSGKSKIHQKPIDIREVAQGVVGFFRKEAASKKIDLSVSLPGKPILVPMDEDKIRQALGNLLENALEFTDPGGHVRVSVEKLPGYVRVSVMDDGIGIPAKDLSRVFERFYQVESHLTRRHGGMGLGLTVAKAMIELHDGQIWVESVEKKGSNFSFLLPIPDEHEQTRPSDLRKQALSKPFG
jgi:signal transduction histidine kinase